MKIGDLVKMKTHATGLVGIVTGIYPCERARKHRQIGIHWFASQCNKVEWEPEAWVEVVSESR